MLNGSNIFFQQTCSGYGGVPFAVANKMLNAGYQGHRREKAQGAGTTRRRKTVPERHIAETEHMTCL